MRYKALLFGLLFLAICVAFPGSLRADSACSASTTSTGDCPIMDMDGAGKPLMEDVEFPDPIGTIQLPKKLYLFSGPICMVDTIIRNSIEGLYATFIGAFKTPFGAVLMLYVIFYAIGFIYGLVNPKDFAVRAFKITIVWLLVSDNCFFYKYMYESFIDASNEFIMIVSESVDSGPPPANPADAEKKLYTTLDNMFTNVVGLKGLVGLGIMMLASITSNSEGITNSIMTVLGVGAMGLALMRALVTLAMALAGISFFMLFTPIFLSFFMFQATRPVFDNWFKMLISFTIQPFIIFTFVIMMKNVSDKAAPTVEFENIVKKSVDLIKSKEIKPELGTNRPVVRAYKPSKELMEAAGMDVGDGTEFQLQEKFYTEFVRKVLFWFLMNMIMAAFLKEVPAIAQKLGGFISAPSLGATDERGLGGMSARTGIMIPGLSKGSGAETLKTLRDAIKGNTVLRNTVGAGIASFGAYAMYEETLKRKARGRDGAGVDNPAGVKDGANRDGTRAMRASAILGDEKVNRDGTRAGGIGSEKTANRDGSRVEGVGEKDAAARVEMVRRQAENVKAGTENINTLFGLGIKEPVVANQNAREQEKQKILNEIQLKTQNNDTAIYNVNGKTVSVAKADEMAFLKGKIKDLDNDISKSKILGGLSGEARQQALEQRKALMERQQELMKELRNVAVEGEGKKGVLRDEKAREMERAGVNAREQASQDELQNRALDAIREAKERAAVTGGDVAEMARLEQLLPALVKREDAKNIQKEIENLEASEQSRSYAELIRDMKELQATLERTTERTDTTVVVQPLVADAIALEPVPVQPMVITTEDMRAVLPGSEQILPLMPEQAPAAPAPVAPVATGPTIAESLTNALTPAEAAQEVQSGREKYEEELLRQQEDARVAAEKARFEEQQQQTQREAEESARNAQGASLGFVNLTSGEPGALPELVVPAPEIPAPMPESTYVEPVIPAGVDLAAPIEPVAPAPAAVAPYATGPTIAESITEAVKSEESKGPSAYEQRLEEMAAQTQAAAAEIKGAPSGYEEAPQAAAPVSDRDSVTPMAPTPEPAFTPAYEPAPIAPQEAYVPPYIEPVAAAPEPVAPVAPAETPLAPYATGKTFAETITEAATFESKPQDDSQQRAAETAAAVAEFKGTTAPVEEAPQAVQAPVYEREAVNTVVAAPETTFTPSAYEAPVAPQEVYTPPAVEAPVAAAPEAVAPVAQEVYTPPVVEAPAAAPEAYTPPVVEAPAQTYATQEATPVVEAPVAAPVVEAPAAAAATTATAEAAPTETLADKIAGSIEGEVLKPGQFGGATTEMPAGPDMPITWDVAPSGYTTTETPAAAAAETPMQPVTEAPAFTAPVEAAPETIMTTAAPVQEAPITVDVQPEMVVTPTAAEVVTPPEAVQPEQAPAPQMEAAIPPQEIPVQEVPQPAAAETPVQEAPQPAAVETPVQEVPVAEKPAQPEAVDDIAAAKAEADAEIQKAAMERLRKSEQELEAATPAWLAEMGGAAEGLGRDTPKQEDKGEEERAQATLTIEEMLKHADPALYSFIEKKLGKGEREAFYRNMRANMNDLRKGKPDMKKKAKDSLDKNKDKNKNKKKGGLGGPFDAAQGAMAGLTKDLALAELEGLGLPQPELQIEQHREELEKAEPQKAELEKEKPGPDNKPA